MRFAIMTLATGAMLVIGGISSLNGGEEPPSISPARAYQIGGTYGIYRPNPSTSNHIIGGDSRLQLDEKKRRDLLERESAKTRYERGGSYTQGKAEVIGYSKENCVQFAKRITGISRSIGNGGRRGIQGTTPAVGAIGVEKIRTHAVVVTKIEGDKITIEEANWLNNKITRRTLNKSDFIGFIYN